MVRTPYDSEIEVGKPSELGLIAAQAGYRRAQQDYASLIEAAGETHLAIIKEGLLDNDMAHHDRCLGWRILDQQLINAVALAEGRTT